MSWLCLQVDVLLRHFSRIKKEFVKGLVQVAVGAEVSHGAGAALSRILALIIHGVTSLFLSGSHTWGEALGEQHRLLLDGIYQ